MILWMFLYHLLLQLLLINSKSLLAIMLWVPKIRLMFLTQMLLLLVMNVPPPVCLPLMMMTPLFLLFNMRTQEQGGPPHLLLRTHQQGGYLHLLPLHFQESGGRMTDLIFPCTQNFLKLLDLLSTLTYVLL